MNISHEAVEAAAKAVIKVGDAVWEAMPQYARELALSDARRALHAAAPHLMAAILALCDKADNHRGSSMYCKLTTFEVRQATGAGE